jgi:hypothetical protein
VTQIKKITTSCQQGFCSRFKNKKPRVKRNNRNKPWDRGCPSCYYTVFLSLLIGRSFLHLDTFYFTCSPPYLNVPFKKSLETRCPERAKFVGHLQPIYDACRRWRNFGQSFSLFIFFPHHKWLNSI